MNIKFSDVLDLFELVNFGSPFDHEGYICKESGKTYFYSDFGDNEEELPDDINDEKYLDFGLQLLKKIITSCFDTEYFPKSRNIRQLVFYLKYCQQYVERV